MKKLDILRLFVDESLTPFDLANFFDIKPNYARQIILRLKRQGLIFPHPTLDGGQAYSLTDKGEARLTYLAGRQATERKEQEVKEESGPKPQHLSLEEVVLLDVLTKPEKGKFLVTKDGDILYNEKEGYLSPKAALILAAHRRTR